MAEKKENNDKWWKKGVIYQIYPRSFKDGNEDGVGDLPGITSKLEYLQWLGIDAIWLSPIYPSPMIDFGYDVSDFTNVHPLFGTLDDFDRLVAKAHALGLKVILDYVPNHSSDQHLWFLESRQSKESPKRDWYIWRPPAEDGGPPNNWLAITGGSAWSFDEVTGEYYLHSFMPCQPDINWRNPETREAMYDVLRFWLDRGVDGFRIDMITFLMKDKLFRDDPPNPSYDPSKARYQYEKLLHIHSKVEQGLYQTLAGISKVIHEYPDRVSIGEVDYFLELDELNRYYGEGDVLDLPGNFRLVYLPWEAPVIKEFVRDYEKHLPEFAWPNWVLSNHDRVRVASRLGQDQARVAALLLLTLRGTPFIYQGDELGMENVEIPPEKVQDPWERTEPGKGRDGERTPVQWSDEPNAGFSTIDPWLPVSNDYQKVNVKVEREDPRSMLTLHRKLLTLRRESPALSIGSYEEIPAMPEVCFGYKRSYNGETFVVLANFSSEELTLTTDVFKGGTLVLSTFLDREEVVGGENLTLKPNEGCLVKI